MQGEMTAVEITQPGGPEVLALTRRPIPQPKAGQVLIRVAAAGVNRPDVSQREGKYPPPPGASDLPGLEVAGEIVAGDLSGTDLKIGDQVCALTPGGGYAQYCVAPAAHCLPIPAGLTVEQAAGLPETLFTVWNNVFDRGQLADDDTLLVHGGASGIGTTAIQLAAALGHRVYATVGSDERAQAVLKLGATQVFNYRTQDFVEEVLQATNNRGVDVILDMVAGEYVRRNLKALADDGRCVMIATLGGAKAEINAWELLSRRLTLTGSTLRPRSDAYKAKLAAALKQKVWPLLESGRMAPVVHAVFPLENVVQAHQLLDSGAHIGKIILTINA